MDFIAGNSPKKKKKKPKIGFGLEGKFRLGFQSVHTWAIWPYGPKVWTMDFATKQRVLT